MSATTRLRALFNRCGDLCALGYLNSQRERENEYEQLSSEFNRERAILDAELARSRELLAACRLHAETDERLRGEMDRIAREIAPWAALGLPSRRGPDPAWAAASEDERAARELLRAALGAFDGTAREDRAL